MAGWELDRSAQLLAGPWFLVLISVFRIYLKEHASVGTTTTNDSEKGCSTGPSYGLFVLRPSWGASATRRARTGPDSCLSLHHPAWHGLVTGKVEFDWLNERMIANTLYSTYYVQVISTYVQVTYYV